MGQFTTQDLSSAAERAFIDPKKVSLVRKVIDKTNQGKILWQRSSTDFSASVGNSLSMNFIYSSGLLVDQWKQFTVRDDRGQEILEVPNLGSGAYRGAIAALSGRAVCPRDALEEAVDELFDVVSKHRSKDLEKAIQILDRV